MKNNTFFLIIKILIFLFFTNLGFANTFSWKGDNFGGDGFSWNNPYNWSTTNLPGSTDVVEIRSSQSGTWPIIQSATIANPWGIFCGLDNSLGVPTISVNWNGILNLTTFNIGYVADGKLIVNGGEVNCSSDCLIGTGNETWGASLGTIDIYSGSISTPILSFGLYTNGTFYVGGTGIVNIIGGTISADSISHLDTPGSFINIETGELVLDGDARTQVAPTTPE